MRTERLIFERIVSAIGHAAVMQICLALSDGASTRELAAIYGIPLGQVRVLDQFLPEVMASCVRASETEQTEIAGFRRAQSA